jgi:DNA-binding NtrC family response regulator
MPIESSLAPVLIADDQPDVLDALRLLLRTEGYTTQTATSPHAALRFLEANEYSLVLMDLNYARDITSGQEGLSLLTKIKALNPHIPVVVMTAWGSIELAVETTRRGAGDFVTKPWDNRRLLATIKSQLELAAALKKNARLEAEMQTLRGPSPLLIAKSQAMQSVIDVIERVGPSDANILITGENGTGKGVVAQKIHAASRRREQSFIPVNMGGIPSGVFESELFGHVKGAFTDARADRVGRFELANGGTLFLDEIGNVPMDQQSKLLRVVETGTFERVGSSRSTKVDIRLISATNADLERQVTEGHFRQDFLYRLNTVEIHLPPLRDRPEDIPVLADHFLKTHSARYGRTISGYDDSALWTLAKHSWPGNIRELDHAIERGVLMARNATVTAADLRLNGGSSKHPRFEEMSLEQIEAHFIKQALARCDGNANRAAEILQLSRSALYRRLDALKLAGNS